jgi:hypothetical protein
LSQGDVAELIDWMRLVDVPLVKEDLVRLGRVIDRWTLDHGAALREFVAQLEPSLAGISPIENSSNLPKALLNM